MPGTIVINTRDTFSTMLVMSVAEKMQYGTMVPEVTAAGERKYTVELAVTYTAEPGMRSTSEVLAVTLTGGDHAAILGITPGSVVELDRLRCGVSAPEKRENGTVRGGRLYFMASAIRVSGSPVLRQVEKAS